MRLAAIAVVACLAAASPCLAQPAQPAAAEADADFAARKALAWRLAEVMNYPELIRRIVDALGPGQIRQAFPELSSADGDELQEILDRAVVAVTPLYMEAMAEAYAEVFSVEELEGLIAFYSSPVGQKMLAKTPEIYAAIDVAERELQPAFMAELRRQVCAVRRCISEKDRERAT